MRARVGAAQALRWLLLCQVEVAALGQRTISEADGAVPRIRRALRWFSIDVVRLAGQGAAILTGGRGEGARRM